LTGYIDPEGKVKIRERKNFELLGQMVIEYFIKNK